MLLLTGCGSHAENSGGTVGGSKQPVNGSSSASSDAPANENGSGTEVNPSQGGLKIPKLKLPNASNEKADMIGLFVYRGRIYAQTGTHIPPEHAKALVGKKVGRTKGNIDEWSSQEEYATELASSIGEADVFAVQGYDEKFRLMTYMEQDGSVWSEFYECLNGITLRSGADIFKKLGIDNHAASASWETHDSWDYDKQAFKPVADGQTLTEFLAALNDAEPVDGEPLRKNGIFETKEQKFILVTLDDHSEVLLRLFKDGYVMYANTSVFFQVNAAEFQAMWQALA